MKHVEHYDHHIHHLHKHLFNVQLIKRYQDDDEKDLFINAIQKGWKLVESDMHYASISVDPRFREIVKLDLSELSRAEKYFEMVLDTKWDKSKWILYDFIS